MAVFVRHEEPYREPAPIVAFPTARRSPVHLAKVEMRVWLYLSARIGQIVPGEELLDHAWDGRDREGRRLDWNHSDRVIRDKHRHLVIGAFEQIRRSVHADGTYIIDTVYDGKGQCVGYRCRETTEADIPTLEKKGYYGAVQRLQAIRADRQLAAQAERPALEAPQEPSASLSGEADRTPGESESNVPAPPVSYVNGTAYYQRPLVDADGQVSEQAEVGRGHATVPELVEGG